MEKLERIPINSGVVMLPPGRSLMVNTDLLNQAGLRGKLRVVVQPGEIRILPAVEPSAQEVLDRLAGCLGGESSTDYDFGLKIGGLYEAR